VVGYHCFGCLRCLHLQDILVNYRITTWCHNTEDHDTNIKIALMETVHEEDGTDSRSCQVADFGFCHHRVSDLFVSPVAAEIYLIFCCSEHDNMF
jgi:hypothetical protein